MADGKLFPTPIFEGSEKRIEVEFAFPRQAFSGGQGHGGLRALTRAQLDELCDRAACCIVSHRSNIHFDAYVLSESSLFVYPQKLVLKTCGTTKLLNAVPYLLQVAKESLGAEACRVKYSRASFLFPELQPELYRDFSNEVEFLDQHFGQLGAGGCAFVMGEGGLQWHVYVADAATTDASSVVNKGAAPVRTFEVCMTELDKEAAMQFFRTAQFVSAEHTTRTSGIRALAPTAIIDDYVFDPCGYSMNGLIDDAFMTIHITPEAGFSYASVEFCGLPESSFDPSDMVARIAAIFKPGKLVAAMSTDGSTLPAGSDLSIDDANAAQPWGVLCDVDGYGCTSFTRQALPAGGDVWYYNMVQQDAMGVDVDAIKASGNDFRRCNSPVSVLASWPSFATLSSQCPEISAPSSLCADSADSVSQDGNMSDFEAERDMAVAAAMQ